LLWWPFLQLRCGSFSTCRSTAFSSTASSQGRQYRFHNLRGGLFQPQHQPIDCQLRAWYRKLQAKIQRDLAQRIPPFLLVFPTISKEESVLFFKNLKKRKIKKTGKTA
jgi:hypothetical protein